MKEKKIELPEWWPEQETMRILHASNWSYPKTWDDIQGIINYRKNLFPIKLEESHVRLMRIGWFTFHGRDKFHRPVCVMRPMELVRSGVKTTPEEVITMSCHISFYMLNFMCRPGQIENNIIISDLEQASAF